MTKKIALLVLVLITLPALLLSFVQAQEPPLVMVRFIHAFPADSPLDVYVDGALVARGLGYGEATPHLRFPQGEAVVEVRATGSDALSVPFTERTVNLVTSSIGFGHVALVIQTDGFNQPTIARVDDLLSPTNVGQARVHLIHAVPDAGPVDLISGAGAPFLQEIAFNASTGTVDPPVGSYEFVIAPSGSSSGAALAVVENVRLRTGFLHTILLMPSSDGYEVRVFDTPVMADPSAETVLVQIGHGSSGSPAFDVYADGTLLIPDLQLGEVLPHVALPAGSMTLSLRESGSPPTITPAVEQTIDLQSSTGALTLIALGSLEDGSFSLTTFEDELTSLDAATATLRIINGTSNGPLTLRLGDESVANVLPTQQASDPISLLSGVYDLSGMVDDVEINGPLPLELSQQSIPGGTWVTVLAYTTDEPLLSLTNSSLRTTSVSLPGYVIAAVPTATPTTAAPVAATPTPIVATQPAAPIIPDNGVVGTINLNQGVNLQCREYPTSQARSLGLIPNGTDLLIQGFAGPIDPENGELNTPLEPGAFSDIESAEAFEDVWLQADWVSAEEGQVRCWVRADFVVLYHINRDERTYLDAPIKLFELVLLDEPVIQRIPANFPGSIQGTTGTLPPVVAPTPTLTPTEIVVGQLTSSTALLDRISGDRLLDIPAGANVVVMGQDSTASWLYVRYEVLGEGSSMGWVPSSLVDIITEEPFIPVIE